MFHLIPFPRLNALSLFFNGKPLHQEVTLTEEHSIYGAVSIGQDLKIPQLSYIKHLIQDDITL
jgi:hypothetical protein